MMAQRGGDGLTMQSFQGEITKQMSQPTFMQLKTRVRVMTSRPMSSQHKYGLRSMIQMTW